MLDLIGLSPMQLGRINKWCDTKVRYKGVVMTNLDTLKERTRTEGAVKKCTNNDHKWNRHKFNAMGSREEQNDYEAKLAAGRSYWVYFGEYKAEIPKIIFDILKLPEAEGSIFNSSTASGNAPGYHGAIKRRPGGVKK